MFFDHARNPHERASNGRGERDNIMLNLINVSPKYSGQAMSQRQREGVFIVSNTSLEVGAQVFSVLGCVKHIRTLEQYLHTLVEDCC